MDEPEKCPKCDRVEAECARFATETLNYSGRHPDHRMGDEDTNTCQGCRDKYECLEHAVDWRDRCQEIIRENAAAWGAIGTTAEAASDDPDTVHLSDAIAVYVQHERDQHHLREERLADALKLAQKVIAQFIELVEWAAKNKDSIQPESIAMDEAREVLAKIAEVLQ